VAALAGLALVGWIVVEVAIVRQFSMLQPVYGAAGLGLIGLGSPQILGQVASAAMALPMFATVPLWRHWHLRWGATAAEAGGPMPGDDLVPVSQVWSKPDSTWSWALRPLPGEGTRLVTRLRQRYRLCPSGLVTVVLAEFGDFTMMRRMVRGIKRRAEAGTQSGTVPDSAASSGPSPTQAALR
jgi:hypothetical protein